MVSLAIAAPAFGGPSVTFLRRHVCDLAPGRTVLLCNDATGTEGLDCPVLSDMEFWRPPALLGRRVTRGLYYRWRQHFHPGLMRIERERVTRFLAQHRPKVLLAEYGPTGLLLSQTCREAGVPLVVHYHGYDASRLLNYPNYVRHYRTLFRSTAAIVVPSEYLASRLTAIGCPRSVIRVNPYGVDVSRFAPTAREPNRIVAVGRLAPKKAPLKTIQAFARVASLVPGARLDMVGDGSLERECRSLIASLGLTDRVTLHGARDSDFVAALMMEASVFVQHSVMAPDGDTEGLPVAILEAMACALPVVSTRHSGIPEAVKEGETGLLVEEHDVNGMAEAMLALVKDPARAEAMGQAGRERVLAQFTREHSRDGLRTILGLASEAKQ